MQNKFNKAEIEYIQNLAEESATTMPYYDTFRTHLKIHKICTKLGVCSIEEVIRKVLFYNWFELNMSEDYKEHVIRTAREYQSITRLVRNQMLDFGKNVSQVFGDLCTHSSCLRDNEMKDLAENHIKKVKLDKEIYRIFTNVKVFRDLIGNSYNFKMIFDTVFKIDDDFKEDTDTTEQIFKSSSAKYLMTVRMCIENAFPVKKNRELSKEERDLIIFLMYKGDEIDYMEQYSMAVKEFETILNSIIRVYDVVDLQELLIATSVEQSFSVQSLVYSDCSMGNRANALLNNREKTLELIPEENKEKLENSYMELTKFVKSKAISAQLMNQIQNNIDKLGDCDFTTLGKTDDFVEWYRTNVHDLKDIQNLINLINKIENYASLKK